jgi:hypothetical protein
LEVQVEIALMAVQAMHQSWFGKSHKSYDNIWETFTMKGGMPFTK